MQIRRKKVTVWKQWTISGKSWKPPLRKYVTEDQVIVDLKTYADGVIRKEDLSEDPDFNMQEAVHPGDEITATVMATNDGEGNMVLSKKEANAVLAWDKLKKMMEERTVVKVKISEVVNAGAVAYLEGIRGFIPASVCPTSMWRT